MKQYLLLSVVATLVMLASGSQARSQQRAEASAEEYAVYSAVIGEMFTGEKVTSTQNKIKLIVIAEQTGTDFTSDADSHNEPYFRQFFPTVMDGVVNEYKTKNSASAQLSDSFDLKVKRVIVGKEELKRIFNGGVSWQEFYQRYPESGGLIVLSRVGFDAGMTQALVYIQHSCGGLCGTGNYVLLEKSVDGWRVVKRQIVWIS